MTTGGIAPVASASTCPASNGQVHRFYVPGARAIGGRFVTLTSRPAWYADGGTLAAPTRIRGIAIPAGSDVFVDPDFGDIRVRFHAPVRVCSTELRASDEIVLRGRTIGFPGLRIPWWGVPIWLAFLPVMLVKARLAAREIRVWRDGAYAFSIDRA